MVLLLADLNKMANGATSIKDLNWERVKQLTSPTTSYEYIKYFTEHAGTGIHPCVVVEIVLKWWSVRTDRDHVGMSFIKPLITTIQNVSSQWFYHVCYDERYKGLMKTLDIPTHTTSRYMCYRISGNNNNKRNLKDCISKGVGTPAQLKGLKYSRSMDKVYQHSDTMLLYFILMEILNITGTLQYMVLMVINMYYLSLQNLKKRYIIILITNPGQNATNKTRTKCDNTKTGQNATETGCIKIVTIRFTTV